MRAKKKRPIFLSEGERSLFMALLATALFGAGVALAIVMRFDDAALMGRQLSPYELWIVLSGAIGAASALYLLRSRIGQPHQDNPVRAALRFLTTTVLTSALGAVIGGTMALPLYGTMFGPFTLIVILAGSPFLLLLWCANQFAAHKLLRTWHSERDSIFAQSAPIAPLMRRADRAGLIPRP